MKGENGKVRNKNQIVWMVHMGPRLHRDESARFKRRVKSQTSVCVAGNAEFMPSKLNSLLLA